MPAETVRWCFIWFVGLITLLAQLKWLWIIPWRKWLTRKGQTEDVPTAGQSKRKTADGPTRLVEKHRRPKEVKQVIEEFIGKAPPGRSRHQAAKWGMKDVHLSVPVFGVKSRRNSSRYWKT